MRSELIIDIPVEYGDDIRSFTHEYLEASEPIFKFISNNLPKFGVNGINLSEYYIEEVVKNAYDAYAQKGLKRGEKLRLHVVMTAPDNEAGEVTIKIKDNGKGFSEQPKGVYFDRSKVKKDSKPYGALGGNGIGLLNFESDIQAWEGKLLFKNRKKHDGATIDIKFKQNAVPQPTTIKPHTHRTVRRANLRQRREYMDIVHCLLKLTQEYRQDLIGIHTAEANKIKPILGHIEMILKNEKMEPDAKIRDFYANFFENTALIEQDKSRSNRKFFKGVMLIAAIVFTGILPGLLLSGIVYARTRRHPLDLFNPSSKQYQNGLNVLEDKYPALSFFKEDASKSVRDPAEASKPQDFCPAK